MAGGGTASITHIGPLSSKAGSGGMAAASWTCPPDLADGVCPPVPFLRRGDDGSKLTGDPLKPKYEIDATLLREGGTQRAEGNHCSISPPPTPILQQHRPQSVLPLPSLAAAREPGDYAVERLRRVDHRRVFRGHAGASYRQKHHDNESSWTQPEYKPFIPTATSLAASWGSTPARPSAIAAFYIIDRTLPVGFQRGQDLNTDKAILVNRFIE